MREEFWTFGVLVVSGKIFGTSLFLILEGDGQIKYIESVVFSKFCTFECNC